MDGGIPPSASPEQPVLADVGSTCGESAESLVNMLGSSVEFLIRVRELLVGAFSNWSRV